MHKWAMLLVIISAANLGMVSIMKLDLMSVVFGDLTHFINMLVGLSGIYLLLDHYTTLLKKQAKS
jgi:uncharacterized membrane protein YuzA (DUF378 family)